MTYNGNTKRTSYRVYYSKRGEELPFVLNHHFFDSTKHATL